MDVHDDQVDTRETIFSIFRKNKKGVEVPTRKRDFFYNTNHRRRGLAIIFNHETFNLPSLKQRNGTEADCLNLENTLKTIGFETHKYLDLSLKELDAKLDELGAYDYSDCDCLLIAVLSHGEQGVIYAKNTAYSPHILYDRFTPDKCPTLAGKPKVYIIQACQGDKLDGGIDVHTVEVDSDSNATMYRIPLYADFLIAYSTIPGYYSWRNTQKGSWFIQAFCEEIVKHWTEFDFLTILTFVNGRVAFDFESNVPTNPSMHRQKQIPCINSMLTRILKFSPKEIEHNSINNCS